MNKLKIGIILTPIYSPNSGGGYSFHTRLLEGIDNYTFNNNLEIVFINLSKNQIQFSHKQCLHFVPFLKPDLSDRIRRIKMGFLRRVPLFKKSLNKLEKLHSFFMHKKIEDFFMHEK